MFRMRIGSWYAETSLLLTRTYIYMQSSRSISHMYPHTAIIITSQVLNEHTFVVPENLLCFLQQQQSSHSDDKPLFLGHRLTLEDGTAFLSGARHSSSSLLGFVNEPPT